MVLESSDEHLAVRFSPYVEELQDFFAGSDVHFGRPEDIFPFAERLSNPGVFKEEMTSMLRAVIYREHESITQGDLLGLITLAVGGPQIDLTELKFRPAIRSILTFVGHVLRSLWKVVPQAAERAERPERPVVAPQPPFPEPLPLTEVPPRSVPAPSAVPAARAIPAVRFVEEVQVRPDTAWAEASPAKDNVEATLTPRRDLFSRIRGLWREPDAGGEEPGDALYPEYQPVGLFKAKYRPFWLVGLGGISLGLATGLMLRDRPPVPKPVVQNAHSQGFHPWFPPIPQPVPGESFEAETAPLPPLPVPKTIPSPASRTALDAAPIPTRQVAANTPADEGDAALEQRFFSGTHKPAQRLLQSPAPVAAQGSSSTWKESTMTGQSHPPLYPASTLGTRDRGSSGYAQPAPPASSDQTRLYLPRPVAPVHLSPTVALPHESVFLSASGAMAANLLSAPAPVYPELASASHVEGKVIVQAVIGLDGSVIATRVLSGPEFLRAASLNAVRRWRYRPYTVDGKPTVVATNAILNFQLQ